MQIRDCTLCGPDAGKRVLYLANFSEQDLNKSIFSARRLPDGIHGQLVQCQTCEMIFCDPAVDTNVLSQLYQEALVHYDNLEGPIYDSYRPILEAGLVRLKGSRTSFLEIGGGSGFMLRFAKDNGFASATEIEPSRDAEKKFVPAAPSHKFICDIFRPGLVAKDSVSLSCFFQMLDHVPNPREFLQNVFEVMQSGGVAICVTHNTKAISARLLGEKSPIFDIEHTYLFNPENMKALFEKIGFKNVTTMRISNRYPILYWFNLFPFPRILKKVLNPILKALGMGKIRLSIPAGNFAVIGSK
jgi:SAM-dependent methyltransferase